MRLISRSLPVPRRASPRRAKPRFSSCRPVVPAPFSSIEDKGDGEFMGEREEALKGTKRRQRVLRPDGDISIFVSDGSREGSYRVADGVANRLDSRDSG